MRNRDPLPAELIAYLDGITKLLLEVRKVSLRQSVCRRSFLDQGVRLTLEEDKISLTHHRGVGAIDEPCQRIPPHKGVGLVLQLVFEEEDLGEDGCCLGQRERGVESERRVIGSHQCVHSVAQLVCQRGEVVPLPVVACQDPRGHPWKHPVTEGTANLPKSNLGIEVSLVKNALRVIGQDRGEGGEALEDGRHRLIERIGPCRLTQWGIEVIAAELFHPQPVCLQPKVTLKDTSILLADFEEGLDDRVGNIIYQVPNGNRR